MLVYVLIGVVVVIGLIMLKKVRIGFHVFISGENQRLEVSLFFFKGWEIKIFPREFKKTKSEALKEIPKTKTKTKTKVQEKKRMEDPSFQVGQIIEGIKTSFNGFKFYMSRLTFEKFQWETSFGFSEADKTAITYGAISSVLYSFTGWLSHNLKFKNPPQIGLYPYFGKYTASSELYCMVSFRIGHAIIAGFVFLKAYIQTKQTLKVNKI